MKQAIRTQTTRVVVPENVYSIMATYRWRAWSTLGAGIGHAQRRRGYGDAWRRIRPGDPPVSPDTLARLAEEREGEAREWLERQVQAQALIEAQRPAHCAQRWEDHPEWLCPFVRNHAGSHLPYVEKPDGQLEAVPFKQALSTLELRD